MGAPSTFSANSDIIWRIDRALFHAEPIRHPAALDQTTQPNLVTWTVADICICAACRHDECFVYIRARNSNDQVSLGQALDWATGGQPRSWTTDEVGRELQRHLTEILDSISELGLRDFAKLCRNMP